MTGAEKIKDYKKDEAKGAILGIVNLIKKIVLIVVIIAAILIITTPLLKCEIDNEGDTGEIVLINPIIKKYWHMKYKTTEHGSIKFTDINVGKYIEKYTYEENKGYEITNSFGIHSIKHKEFSSITSNVGKFNGFTCWRIALFRYYL